MCYHKEVIYQLGDIPKEDLAYIAGFMDGEGWFGVEKKQGKASKYSYYQIVIAVTITDNEPLLLIKKYFGGVVKIRNMSYVKRNIPNSKKTNYYYYAIRCQMAYLFVKAILPYLRMERRIQKAKLLMELQEHINLKRYGRGGLPKEVAEYRENIFKQKFI